MPSRVIYRYVQGKRGWTEVFYSASGHAIAGNIDEFGPFLASRLALLSADAIITTVTAVDLTNPRASTVTAVNERGGAIPPLAFEGTPDYTNVAVLFRMSSPLHTRSYWMRGVLEANTSFNPLTGDYHPSLNTQPFLNAIRDNIKTRYSTRGLQPIASADWQPILKFEPTVPAGFTQITGSATAVLPAVNGTVVFRGMPHLISCFLPSRPKVLSVDAGTKTFVIQAEWPSGLASQYVQAPTAYRSGDQVLSQISGGDWIRISSHDTGRPTNLPRGRSRARMRRQ